MICPLDANMFMPTIQYQNGEDHTSGTTRMRYTDYLEKMASPKQQKSQRPSRGPLASLQGRAMLRMIEGAVQGGCTLVYDGGSNGTAAEALIRR